MPLITKTGMRLPGGYAFFDHKLNKHYTSVIPYRDRLEEIRRDRVANPTIFTQEEMSEDYIDNELESYTCLRLGNDSRYCGGGGATTQVKPAPNVSEIVTGIKCPKCGSTEWKPRYCKTCSGRRVVGYNCAACGTSR